jgi:protein involved in polysaccharide export with SLBB domain
MKIIISAFILLQSFSLAQVSLSDLNKLNNSQLDEIREKLSIQNPSTVSAPESVDSINQESIEIEIEQKDSENPSSFFGYDYFNKQINFFDNIPTPVDFKLGAGDEIILSLWGEKNSREKFILNKDGMIYYQNIGFINLSGKTLNEAENLLSSELSRIYSTLNSSNNSTQLMLELGKIKSVNVYFSGQVSNPGINLIHPFSDIFSALIQAGSVKNSGSLRKVQIIRNSEVIAVVDFYSFFLNGMNSFSNIRILDGDVIHVPVVANRAEIKGEIINPGFYELLDSDSLSNLIDYAGGLSSMASDKAVINDIIPIDKRDSDDIARSGRLILLSQTDKIKIQNGSVVELIPIAKNDTSVSVFGRVVRPGEYPIDTLRYQNQESGITLKEVLDIAGGFEDPNFRKTINDEIVILRLDENQFYAKELRVNYSDANSFKLEVNDKIFVYELPQYRNSFTYTIKGEVNSPGTYPLKEGLSLSQAIKLAGGITEIGSVNSVSVSKNLVSIDSDGNKFNKVELVSNIDLNFQIADQNIITILPNTNVIRVNGNVYNPGLIAHQSGNGLTMSKAIELAGGYKPYSLKKRAYVIRANGEIEQAGIFSGKAKRVFPGDSIFIPVNPDPKEFDITSFIADLSSTLANIAAILVIANNNN